MKSTKEIINTQEIVQAISNVIPQFTKGKHLLAELLTGPAHIRFASEDERKDSDLFRVLGLTNIRNKSIDFDIRLYGAREENWMGLQCLIKDSSLNTEIFVAWHGGAVSQEKNRVYIALTGDTDMSFNLDTESFGIRTAPRGTFEFNYPIGSDGKAVQKDDQRFFQTKNGFLLSEPWVGPDAVSVKIQKPEVWGATLHLQVPSRINRIDLNALPQLS
jgi:hypothetical protein